MKKLLLLFTLIALFSSCASTGAGTASDPNSLEGCRQLASTTADSGMGGGNLCQKKVQKPTHTNEFLYRKSH